MNALFIAFGKVWLPLAAGTVGAFVPGRKSASERLWVALLTALSVFFVSAMWPDSDRLPDLSGDVAASMPHILSWTIAIPALGALAVLFVPRQAHKTLQWVAFGVMVLELVATLMLLRLPAKEGWWIEESAAWIPAFGIRYHVALDGISLWLVVLTGALTPLALWVSFGSIHNRIKDFCFAFLLLESAMVGSLVAVDLFVYYVFWELMLVPMYVMIGVWGGVDRIRAAIKFFIYTMAGSMLLLVAILWMVFKYRALSGGEASFDLTDLQRLTLPLSTQRWLFAAFALAFLIKVPMWPVHTWLPDAHTQAPTGGSIILAAVMLKIGAYAYIRFAMTLFPHAAHQAGATLGGIAVLGGILYGALCALKQNDVKRLVAYSSVSHLGYVMLGIFARNPASMEGAILQMVNHGISTGALFLLVGVIYDRRHTRELAEFGGLAKSMPWYAVAFVIVTFSSIGLPGTNGFVGEFLVITGAFMSRAALGPWGRPDAIGAALGVILGAAYMLTVVQKMFWGPLDNPKNKALPDLTKRELVTVTPLILLIFIVGFFPRLLTEPMHPSVQQFCKQLNDRIESPLVDQAVLAPKPEPVVAVGEGHANAGEAR